MRVRDYKVIEPHETRRRVARALAMLWTKYAAGRKH
jgi:hypothetical protein